MKNRFHSFFQKEINREIDKLIDIIGSIKHSKRYLKVLFSIDKEERTENDLELINIVQSQLKQTRKDYQNSVKKIRLMKNLRTETQKYYQEHFSKN